MNCRDCDNGLRRYFDEPMGVWMHDVGLFGGRAVCGAQHRSHEPVAKYRCKHAVEARRWIDTDENRAAFCDWFASHDALFTTRGSTVEMPDDLGGVFEGAWIVWSDGEFLVMEDDTFAETYEPVESPHPSTRMRMPARADVTARPGAVDWIINDIKIASAAAPPLTDEDLQRMTASASRHDPQIARTLMDRPGNRSNVNGCHCHAEGVDDAATWATHIGIPGGERFIESYLRLRDIVQDIIDYPREMDPYDRLREVLRETSL